MLIMIPYSLDELVAMGQFLVLNTRRGRPFWRSFFRGDALPGGSKDSHPGFDAPLAAIGGSAARGVTVRSEEHTSELQSLMRITTAVFCLKKKKNINIHRQQTARTQ